MKKYTVAYVKSRREGLYNLKLKAEFQEEEHASTMPTESIICPCLTMSRISHSHSASDQNRQQSRAKPNRCKVPRNGNLP